MKKEDRVDEQKWPMTKEEIKDCCIVYGTVIGAGCLLGGPVGAFWSFMVATPYAVMAYHKLKEWQKGKTK